MPSASYASPRVLSKGGSNDFSDTGTGFGSERKLIQQVNTTTTQFLFIAYSCLLFTVTLTSTLTPLS